MLDRRDTGSDRVRLWQIAGEKMTERPWLGYGYGAFWRGSEGPASDVRLRAGWFPVHAQNGFLDVAVAIGGVGLLILCAHLLRTTTRAFRRVRLLGPVPSSLWPVMFVMVYCVCNIPETSLMVPNNPLWSIYVALVLSLSSPSVRERGDAAWPRPAA